MNASKTNSFSTVLVFHPGSRNLYFGKASDLQPQSIPHIIARKRKDNTSQAKYHRDIIVPISERKINDKIPPEVESARLQLIYTLQTAVKSGDTGIPKSLSNIDNIVSYNKAAKRSRHMSGRKVESNTKRNEVLTQAFIVGNEVLRISPKQPYNIHCPWRRGQLNLHRDVGGSLTSVMTDLEDIWRWCITEKLAIPEQDINSCRAVVVVPAMFDRVHAKEIMNLVINRLGFKSAFLIQDHVCASFACCIPCATVVDVGDQKISISCVEDGVSYPQSRVELKYGGGDLTIALWNQLTLTHFPIPIDISQQWDLEFLNELKEKHCHVRVNECGPKDETILWDKPYDDEEPAEYLVRFGDELLIVPLSYFNPDLLRGSTGRKAVICYGPQPSVSDDPFDRIYLAETFVTSKRGLKDGDSDDADDDDQHDQKSQVVSQQSKINFDQPLGIDQAILQSIGCCNVPDDTKGRLYSSIIVVGGGFTINGLAEWLTNRMKHLIPKQFKSDSQRHLQIVTNGKEGEPCTTVWKGAAILSTFDTTKELWINAQEWRKLGSKILRERSLFQF